MDVARSIGNVERGELVEAELDHLVRRRHDQRVMSEGSDRLAEEMYEESVRVFNARRAQERREEWAAYHRQQAERHRATLTDLIAHHLAQAEKLELGNGEVA